MNVNSTHIIKTWLKKAVAVGSDAESRPVLGYAGITEYAGCSWIASADGYRLHASQYIPARLRTLLPGTALVDIADQGERKWLGTPRFPDVGAILNKSPNFGGKPCVEIKLRPRDLISSLKWIINTVPEVMYVKLIANAPDEGEEHAYLKVTDGNGIWNHINIPGIGISMDYSSYYQLAFNPQYMLDALWMWYYQDEVFITVNKEKMIFIEHPCVPHLAAIMAANLGTG